MKSGDVNDQKQWAGILGYFEILTQTGQVDFRSSVRPGQLGSTRCATGCWFRWNSQHRKIVPLSPHVKNLKVKRVIKVSYLNQESCQCFVFFRFLCTWTFYTCEYFTYPYHGYITVWLDLGLNLSLPGH